MAQLNIRVESRRTHIHWHRGYTDNIATRNEIVAQLQLRFTSGEQLGAILLRAARRYPQLKMARALTLITSCDEKVIRRTHRPRHQETIQLFVGYWPG